MTPIFTVHPLETPEIARLRYSINNADKVLQEYIREARRVDRAQSERYNELMLAQRPNYPTAEQLGAIATIAQMVREGTVYGDTHGYSDVGILPTSVRYASRDHRINIVAGSPNKAGSGDLLWEFTPEEVAAFQMAIADNGLTTFSQWDCHDGLAFVVVILSGETPAS